MPHEIRESLRVKLRQHQDGAVVVRPQPSALDLFGKLKSTKKFPGRAVEREAVAQVAGRRAAKEGVQ